MIDNLLANWPLLAGVLAALGFTNRESLAKLPALLANIRGTSLVIESHDEREEAFSELLALKRRLESFDCPVDLLASLDEIARAILQHKAGGK